MPHDRLTEDTTECGLHSFERNHFFHGKLLTARDMQAEQHYHRNRLRTLAQQVLGSGIVCGLGTTVELDDETLVVEIDRGLAIDACGHPTVVETDATRELDPADVPDPVSLYLDYHDAQHETVPVPGTDGACEDECTYNRVLEGFELVTEADPPPERTSVEHVAFPDRSDYDTEGDGRDPTAIEVGDDALRSIAASFAEADDGTLRPCATGSGAETGDDHDAHRVFLGRFGTGDDGTWGRVTDGVEARAHVYTNDMLYAAISRHAARFDDPHDVTAAQTGAVASVDGVSNPGGDVDLVEDQDGTVTITPDDDQDRIQLGVGSAVTDRLDRLERDVEALSERVLGMERQLLRSTLQHKRAAFSLLSDRFDVPGADEVVAAVERGLSESVYEEPEAYYEFLTDEADDGSTIVDRERAVGEALRGAEGASGAGLAQYARAVGRLSTLVTEQSRDDLALEGPEYVQRVARAQGLVAETAEWIGGEGDAGSFADAAESSLTDKASTFERVAEDLGVDAAADVAEVARRAREAGDHESPDAYADFVRTAADSERHVVTVLVEDEVATAETTGAYAVAVQRLVTALEEGADPAALLDAQDRVTAAADGLQPGDGELSVTVDPSGLTVDELRDALADVTTVGQAGVTLAIEMATQDRTTAIDLVLGRIRQLEPDR